MFDIPEEISFQFQNIGFFDLEIEDTLPADIIHEKFPNEFAVLKRYLLLHSVAPVMYSQEIIDEIAAVMIPEYDGITELMHDLNNRFFHAQYLKIFKVNEKMLEGSEMECAEFILSRCELMCIKPTFFSFMLVTSFLSYLIVNYFYVSECYRILYIAEFCFDVLYSRIFCKVFKSKEDIRKLQLLCDELDEGMTLESILREWRECSFAVDWIRAVENCVNNTDDTFSLRDSEIELFNKFYSLEINLEDDNEESPMPPESEKTGNDYFHASKYFQSDCATCQSKCYNYLSNLNFIKEIRDKYFN